MSKVALAGNRTRASRVAGENSTTEPPMHVKTHFCLSFRVKALPLDKSISGQLSKSQGTEKIMVSPSGNRTPVSRVTGGDTHHYTNEDTFGQFSLSVKNPGLQGSFFTRGVSGEQPRETCPSPTRRSGRPESNGGSHGPLRPTVLELWPKNNGEISTYLLDSWR